ncbi:MAG: gliding motility-associated C-terminal domain-containing protein, partial [Bacteroidetes bacterium]|nr:gliding motility-associated C-terminal domain-containing protein [Bacteroidota bacterium]
VYVELLPEITFPNGFSPNGDGINDTWQLDLMIDFPECVIEVYNRWGNSYLYLSEMCNSLTAHIMGKTCRWAHITI